MVRTASFNNNNHGYALNDRPEQARDGLKNYKFPEKAIGPRPGSAASCSFKD